MSKSIICIGAALVDELYFCNQPVVSASSNPAHKTSSTGGVMCNVVQNLALLGVPSALLTALGNDADGTYITNTLTEKGIAMTESLTVNDPTGKYVSILNPDGSLNVAVCQDISAQYITVPFLASKVDYLRQFDLIITDTNLDSPALQWLIDFANAEAKPLIIEPVSVTKAAKLAELNLSGVYMITPNEEELPKINSLESENLKDHLDFLFRRGVANVWLRKGSQGSVLHQPDNSWPLPVLPVPTIPIVDSTGAGDAALAGWVFGYWQEADTITCLQWGHALALAVLQIKGAVDPTLHPEKVYQIKQTYYHD